MLDSNVAVSVSKKIIYVVVSMRKFINENKDIFNRLTTVEYEMIECKDKIDGLFDKFETKKVENQKIFFDGEIYDAYSLIIQLIKVVKVELITSSHYLTKLDINKFNSQYINLKIKYSNIFHDRFIIIDNPLYHLGFSLKDLGKKCFGINKIEDKEYLDKILEKII